VVIFYSPRRFVMLYKLLIKAGLISNTYIPAADVVLRRKAAREVGEVGKSSGD
jgi:hypothetical protein